MSLEYHNLVDIKIKQIENGVLPVYKTDGAAAADCSARVKTTVPAHGTKIIPLGFSLELPTGAEAQIRPRSGLSSKGIIAQFGTIDSDYRGEVGAIIYNTTDEDYTCEAGDRISQMVITPSFRATFRVVAELNDTKRGADGFGSTGLGSAGL